MVLLALRASWKEESQASTAELLYGTQLTLPNELVTGKIDRSHFASSSFVRDLGQRMAKLGQPPVHFHGAKETDDPKIPAALLASPYVFVRREPQDQPLQPPYEGPFLVKEANPTYFILDKQGKDDIVAIDRLKPASAKFY